MSPPPQMHMPGPSAADAIPPDRWAGTGAPARPAIIRHPLAFALILTGLAGFLDAAAFVQFDHLYVSFMSGNSTHLGLTLAGWDIPRMLAVLAVICAFVAGSAAGTWIADHHEGQFSARVLALEAVLLCAAMAAALASLSLPCVMIVALTMGLQNVLHQAVCGVDVGKGFVTGMLFHLGQSLARLVSGKAKVGHVLTSLFNWLAFVAGAAAGALALPAIGFTGCLLVGAGIILALLARLWRTGRSHARPIPLP
ncbi:YoaK family protein [Aquabacter sp. P-9]|uniref:YoaK family protein n=1 Tax=Aquabacter sediminis TaxID=3029197 RepID=UPI00237D8B1B|nr:YoaK family protein [Aquabacter sp. P-9]MDE1568620.1 YoaK family protein [Aquabacter sp. P-9]